MSWDDDFRASVHALTVSTAVTHQDVHADAIVQKATILADAMEKAREKREQDNRTAAFTRSMRNATLKDLELWTHSTLRPETAQAAAKELQRRRDNPNEPAK